MTIRSVRPRVLGPLGFPLALALAAPFGQAQSLAPPDGAASAPSSTLPVIRATAGAQESATGPVQGYRAARAATATRTDTPVFETPVSVQTVTRDLLDDQRPSRLADALSNVSGVFRNHGPDGNTMDTFIIRGFATDAYGGSYLDGVKDFSRGPKEIAGLERVEVLKGPAAILYGRIEPGGLINRVSKRPQVEAATTLTQEVGSHQHLRTTLDSTGALLPDASWLYRVNVAVLDEDSFKDFTHNRRLHIAPQLEWRPSAATTLRLGLEYLKDKRSWAATYGTIGDDDGPVDIPIETNLHGKDDAVHEESTAFKLEWSHRLGPAWTVQQRLSFGHRNSRAEASGLSEADAAGNYTRDYWGWEGESTNTVSTHLELLGRLEAGGARHTLLAGVDFYRERYDSGGWAYGGTEAPSNIHAPVYDEPYRGDYTVTTYKYSNRNAGLYLQDQVALFDGRLQLLAGMRYDRADNTYRWDARQFEPEDKKATWRAGILFKLQPTLAVHASYVTGFGQSQYDWDSGGVFAPQTSKQFEAGVKFEPSSNLSLGVAAFELIKDNLTMGDPDNPLRTILAGEATSRGVEVDVSGRLSREWDVVASYAFTNVRYTRSDTMQGERLAGVPRHGASLWSSYRFGDSGWRAGAGVVVRSSMPGVQKADTAHYPYTHGGYTLVNSMLGYDFELAGREARAQLNVQNLSDKRYTPTTYGGQNRLGLGEPRSVVASLAVTF